MRARGSRWAVEQNARWASLLGAAIRRWDGCQTNVGTDDDVVFQGIDSLFGVHSCVTIDLDTDDTIEFSTYTSGDASGLRLLGDRRECAPVAWRRHADLAALPVGHIDRVEVRLDAREVPPGTRGPSQGVVVEALLEIEGRSVLLVAAQVYAGRGAPEYGWGDEDVFVFTDPAEVDAVPWITPRRVDPLDVRADGTTLVVWPSIAVGPGAG